MLRKEFIRYLEIEKRYSPHTVKAYIRDLDDLAAFLSSQLDLDLFDKKAVRKVNHRTLRSWMGALLGQGLSARSVARKVSSARAYFGFLQRSDVLNQNPARQLKATRIEQKLPLFLKEHETEALLDDLEFPAGFQGARDRCMLELLYGCGLRRSELIGLKPQDVDRFERTLRVTGKGNKERVLPFGKSAATAIDAYLAEATRLGFSFSSGHHFFVRENGSPLYPQLVYRVVKKYLSQVSGLRQRSPHVLRHTFATHLLDHGADLNAIKDLLGHESLAATQVYTHNSISKLKSIHQLAHPRAENKKGE